MSDQLDELKKLYAQEKTYKIPSEAKEGEIQAEIKIKPLSLEDVGLMDIKDDMPLSELAKQMILIISKSLGVEKEEAKNLSFEYMDEVLKDIMDANNFDEEDAKKAGIKPFLNKKREQIEQAKVENGGEPDKPTKK